MIVDQKENLGQANARLGELIFEHFRDYPLDDLIIDALPVRRQSDGKVVATAVFAHPRGHPDRTVGCMYPRVTESA